jgi:hypothetical protein
MQPEPTAIRIVRLPRWLADALDERARRCGASSPGWLRSVIEMDVMEGETSGREAESRHLHAAFCH